jgi:TPR repeat protein
MFVKISWVVLCAIFDDSILMILSETIKKAEAGDASAQYNLGVMYATGDGVLKDSAEAVKWFRKSAEQGIAEAQLNLGVMYDNGEGVLKDSVQAHAWWNNASANGNEQAKENLSIIEKNMTPEQIAEATKLAREIFNRTHTAKN